jgi:light-regulated signal transduction histidine kinase (bacteriophytochrome)
MEDKPLTILIIDDSPEDHELYREYLGGGKAQHYRFIDAYCGEEGEKLYQDNQVDCVLLDYRMPDLDGLEVLQRLTSISDIVPVVMMTGDGNENVAVVAMKTGSKDYLPKRVITPQALRRTVERTVEHARLTNRLKSYRTDLERSNQDLERFVSVVAHDLKSPLRAITQHLQLVRERTKDALDEKTLKSIAFAVDGAERMRLLIEGMFEFSKAGFEKHPVTSIDCNDVLHNVRANLISHIEESGAVITSDHLPTVVADGVQITQLLQNLIGNALKFCKGTPHIHISVRQDEKSWVFSVKDNGIGIPKNSQDKIFTIFHRLHRDEYEGSGVGLAICHRVLENHGGTIHVESEPGQGSTFTFTLPISEAADQEAA